MFLGRRFALASVGGFKSGLRARGAFGLAFNRFALCAGNAVAGLAFRPIAPLPFRWAQCHASTVCSVTPKILAKTPCFRWCNAV